MNGFDELRNSNDGLRIVRNFCVLLCVFCGSVFAVKAQSINQNLPMAITSNEISGQIPARDIGDARLTNYFYVFNATQGDVFINVVTTNLNGDIDIFTADNLRPLSKITIYADASGETGRIVYLRQPTKLILRIEGRTPNDNPATYRIKFAGSFAPAEATAERADSAAPQIKSDNQTDVRVNSVGTIIEIKTKPIAQPKETIAETKPVKTTKAGAEEKTEISEVETEPKKADDQTTRTERESTIESQKDSTATAIADEVPKKETLEIENPKLDSPAKIEETVESSAPVKKKTVSRKKAVGKETVVETTPKASVKPKVIKPIPASALENIRLVILFKDGTKIERPMSDVLKVGVDKGVLTVIAKGGQINRYSILDVEKMTIE